MYLCMECGREFDVPVEWEERHGLAPDEGPGEKWSACPTCHSTDIAEVWRSGECIHGDEY